MSFYGIGDILPVSVIMGAISSIISDQRPANQNPLGIMTTENRDKWANIRDNLTKSAQNEASLRDLDTSLFVLSLDEDVLGEAEPVRVTRQYLHGDGTNRLVFIR